METATGTWISLPSLDPVTGKWVVRFARFLNPQRRGDGYVSLWITADHLAEAMSDVFPESANVAALVRNDGFYLARSQLLTDVMGKAVPATRPYITQPHLERGNYDAIAGIDNTDRIYGWQRVHPYPLAILVGLNRAQALAITNEAIADSRRQNLIGSALVLIAALLLTWLWVQRSLRAHLANDMREQLELAIEGGDVAIWSWNLKTQELTVSERWQQLYGLRSGAATCSASTRLGQLHPEDIALMQQALQRYLGGSARHYMADFRLQQANGSVRYVAERGRVVEFDRLGKPLRLSGTTVDISERKQAELARVSAEALLKNLVAQVPGALYQFLVKPDGTAFFPYASPGVLEIYGASATELGLSAKAAYAVIDPAHLQQVQQSIAESQATLTTWHCEYLVHLPNGQTKWLSGSANPERLADGSTLWHGYLKDITERHEVMARLQESELRLRTLLEQFPEGVLIEDAEHRLFLINVRFATYLQLHGAPDRLDSLVGHDIRTLPSSTLLSALLARSADQPGNAAPTTQTLQLGERHLEITWVAIEHQNQHMGRVWLARDATDQKEQEEELKALATTDTLTQLPNRRAFMHRLQHSAARTAKTPDVLIMLDIDHFKRVNDTYGHPVGDTVLQELAKVMQSALRPDDLAGRLGGEEFAILLHQVTVAEAHAIAERLRTAVANTAISADGATLHITISLGLTPVTDGEPGTILARADAALYAAKNGGRNRVCRWNAANTR